MPKKDRTGKAEEKKPAYEIKFGDRTAAFERDILRENPPRLSYLTRLFRYVFSSARLMCGIFLGLAIVLSVMQPITAFIWGRYIDGADAYAAEADRQTAQLASLVILALFYWAIDFLGKMINRYLYGGEDIERLSRVQDHRLQERFQARLFRKISRLYPDYMEVPKINDIIGRSFDSMGGEWSSLQRGVIIEGYVIIAKAVSVAMVAASLYIFHPLLCLIVLAAPIPTLYTTYVGNKLNFKFTRDNGKILREAGYYQGVMLGGSAKEVKALNLFDFFFAKWKALADDYVIKEKKNLMRVFILGAASGFMSNIAGIAANVFAIVLLTQGRISVGALGAVLALIGTLMGSTSQLFGSIAGFISKKNESAQFFEFIDLKEQVMGGDDGGAGKATASAPGSAENSATASLPSLAPGSASGSATDSTTASVSASDPGPAVIEAIDVSYRYPLTDEYRIRNVSFRLRKGEKVAFVGENGAGKTTFVKLLTGLLQPAEGKVVLYGADAGGMDPAVRYGSMSCVMQEPARFNTFTVADNVFMGDVGKGRDEARIDGALAFAGFEGADREAELGKDIGGTDLSGGQWQKLAIARAHYRERGFIVLDEPTSNLDPIAEAEVFKKYIAMSEGKTVIMVTHRISVASLADRVVVFKDGGIAEDGTHDGLLEGGGEYARLYSTQAQWYDR
ncbi:MAG: ABC transporter ATP-binding protein/permease [Oscillospiraceae bacterium]|nr:ABC transporter ATP-binding protein/permease [Oscillospiraceae bacterium]